MNVLFCNIAWMKDYTGVREDDKPLNGGKYIEEHGEGGEQFNFLDYNGKCYGYVMAKGKMALEKHYENVRGNQPYINDVLVVWAATNESNQTRIVGWYKNARVYRDYQFQEAFTNETYNLYYNVEATAKDCFLLPVDQRTFPIQRAAASGPGTGFGQSNVWYAESSFGQTVVIPKVLEYIDTYNGKFANKVFTDEMLQAVVSLDKTTAEYKDIFNDGKKSLGKGDILTALKLFNTAKLVNETTDVIFNIAACLEALNCFDQAIPIYERLIELEGDKYDTVFRLLSCYDFKGNREKSLEYCNRILPFVDDTSDEKVTKLDVFITIAEIHFSLKDFSNSRASMNRILSVSDSEENKKIVAEWNKTIDQEISKWKK